MIDWKIAASISDRTDVHEALKGFSEDPTGDNGALVVRTVLEAATSVPTKSGTKADAEILAIAKEYFGWVAGCGGFDDAVLAFVAAIQ